MSEVDDKDMEAMMARWQELAKDLQKNIDKDHLVLDVHNGCDHGVVFDEEECKKSNMTSAEVKKRWPRGGGLCPKGCGFNGIAYASYAHYIYGDW